MDMRSIPETVDFLKNFSDVVEERIHNLQQSRANPLKIERELWRKKLVEETLRAVGETLVTI